MKIKQTKNYSGKNLKLKSVIKAKKETVNEFNRVLNKAIDHEEQQIIEGEIN